MKAGVPVHTPDALAPGACHLPYYRHDPSRALYRRGPMTRFNQPLGGNEMPRFGGPASMMRLPVQETAEGLDACFLGVPMDIGTSNRPGTRLGPRQIRDESRMLRPYNMATGAAPFEHLQVADIGDVPINTFDLKKSVGDHRTARIGRSGRGRDPADPWRRSHADMADPEGDEGAARAGGADPCGCACRYQRSRCSAKREAHGTPLSPRLGGRLPDNDRYSRSVCAARAIPPTISTGAGRRAGRWCRPRSAGTGP